MKTKKIYLNYDKKRDVLYIGFASARKTKEEKISKKIKARVDIKSGKTIGYSIQGLKKQKFLDIDIKPRK